MPLTEMKAKVLAIRKETGWGGGSPYFFDTAYHGTSPARSGL